MGTTLWVFLVLLHSVFGDLLIDKANEEQRRVNRPNPAVPPNPQIINGQPAAPGQFPWQVRVIGQAPEGESLCGGSLIHPQWVLTAAHCVWLNGALLSNFSVILGSLVRPGFEPTRIKMDVPSINVIKNSLYDESTVAWDAALIKLPFPAPMPTRTTNPVMINIIKLPPVSMRRANLAGRMTTVSGWGWTSDPGDTSPMLRFTTGPIITLASCRSKLPTLTIHDHNLCTDIPKNQTSCQGDSGGPVVMQDNGRWLLIGVVSFGDPDSCLNGPSINVNVLSLLDWIRRTAGVS